MLDASVRVGSTLRGSYTSETDTPGSTINIIERGYDHSDPQFGIRFGVGATTVISHAPAGVSLGIRVRSNFPPPFLGGPDEYHVQNALAAATLVIGGEYFRLSLIDDSGTALPDLSLPIRPPGRAAWTSATFHYHKTEGDPFFGTISRLDADIRLVPEPNVPWLVVAVSLLLAFRAHTNRTV